MANVSNFNAHLITPNFSLINQQNHRVSFYRISSLFIFASGSNMKYGLCVVHAEGSGRVCEIAEPD